MKALRLGSMDVTDVGLEFTGTDIEGLEVVLTDSHPRVIGSVALPEDMVFTSVRVVVFPADRAKLGPGSRYLRVVRPDADGHFSTSALPPGEYIAAAVDRLESGEERNPQLLERLRVIGEPVEIGQGESVTVKLRVIRR